MLSRFESENYTSHMTRHEVMNLLRSRRWTVSALADRWGYSRRHVTAKIADEGRGLLWDDAFRGLPEGPGFYRTGLARPADAAHPLGIGGLVASEADMHTFDYGARGVVVEVLGRERWLVVWDGGTEMEIDGACLDEWVVDLGLVIEGADRLRELPLKTRIGAAKLLDLNS